MEKNNKKKLEVLKLINSLNINQLKVYSVLKNLEEKNGYSFMSTKNLAKQLELDEKEVISILYFLVKKRLLYFIDIKDNNNKLLEKRLYTNKFNYFKDCRKKDKLEPHIKKEKYFKEPIFKKKELTQKEKDILEINKLVEEYWENMDSLEYAEKYELAEKKFRSAIQVKELNSFQQMIFEKTAEIYMKEVIKQEIAKNLGKSIDSYLDIYSTAIFPQNKWAISKEKDEIEDVFLFK